MTPSDIASTQWGAIELKMALLGAQGLGRAKALVPEMGLLNVGKG